MIVVRTALIRSLFFETKICWWVSGDPFIPCCMCDFIALAFSNEVLAIIHWECKYTLYLCMLIILSSFLICLVFFSSFNSSLRLSLPIPLSVFPEQGIAKTSYEYPPRSFDWFYHHFSSSWCYHHHHHLTSSSRSNLSHYHVTIVSNTSSR